LKAIRACALLLALCAAPLAAASGGEGPLHLHEKRMNGSTEISGENTDPDVARWIQVSFASAQNVSANPPLPAGFVLQPLEHRVLFTVQAVDPGQGYAYDLSELLGEGDPGREPDKDAVYLLPFDHGTKHLVTQGYFGKVTHQGQYALDFDLAEGTAVDAARAGVVYEVKQDSETGGPLALFAPLDNYIKVMHSDDTWAVYAHLQKGGALVQKGQQVEAGERIGLSGHTGLASGPHLHFAVYRAGWQGPRTIPTTFLTGLSRTASLEEGRTYYSWHPGQPAFVPVLGENMGDADFKGLTRTARGAAISLRQEAVDRRNFVWADNPTASDVVLSVDFEQAQDVRPSVGLPFQVRVPAGTEVYCFYVDYIGTGASSFKLRASWQAPANR
jgi:murein DD-endopeptidase MepM/ murein hydrolase activator NlpD